VLELGVRQYTVVYMLDVYIRLTYLNHRNQVVKLQPEVATGRCLARTPRDRRLSSTPKLGILLLAEEVYNVRSQSKTGDLG
jgi:hypothetical protein